MEAQCQSHSRVVSMVLLHSRVAMLKSTQRQATKARRKNLQCSQHKKKMFKETERLP